MRASVSCGQLTAASEIADRNQIADTQPFSLKEIEQSDVALIFAPVVIEASSFVGTAGQNNCTSRHLSAME